MCCRSNGLSDTLDRQATQIQSLFEQGRGEEAIGALLAEIAPMVGVPRHAPRVVTFGTRLLKAGDPQKALSYFDNVLSPNDRSDWGLYGRALAHRLLGEEAQAQADLAQAIAVAETHQQARRFDFDGPIARMYESYRQEITWAHKIDLPLYHLALGNAQQAEQMVRDALSQAPVALLQLAARGLEDLAALFPDDAQAHALLALLRDHLQQGDA